MEGTTYPRMNRVLLTGIAQESPELRYTPSGVTVCSFRVQVGRILRDRTGGSREVAAYLTVVAWQEAAQRMSRDLKKGQAVYVEGYVSSRSFTTARGEKRTAVEIYAEQIQILGPFAEGENPADAVPEEPRPAGNRGRGPSEPKHDEAGHGHDEAGRGHDEHGHEEHAGEAAADAPAAEHHEESLPREEEGTSEDTLPL
jgi:single-strand DNA-binding protein